MRPFPNLLLSILLAALGIAMYLRASSGGAEFTPILTSGFFIYIGILLIAARGYWRDVYLLHGLKWIFSDLSFPRGERWLSWWGGFLIILAMGSLAKWCIGLK